jgi:dienelactone hydrolase
MRSALSVLVIVILWFVSFDAHAELHKETLQYTHGDAILEGHLSYDDTIKGSRPGILVVHDWMGLGPYAEMRADQLAELGYVAFAIDMYGRGVRPKNSKEASAQATIYRKDRQLMRSRAKAGLDVLVSQPLVDSKRVAAIGYCFGGGTVLELARSGADVAGVVSFHGNLDTPRLDDAKNIEATVLVLHGADDPHVPEKEVAAFQEEMRQAKVDWQMVIYGGAVHSFSNPNSGDDPSTGAAYNEKADKRSWEAMRVFFDELFNHIIEKVN